MGEAEQEVKEDGEEEEEAEQEVKEDVEEEDIQESELVEEEGEEDEKEEVEGEYEEDNKGSELVLEEGEDEKENEHEEDTEESALVVEENESKMAQKTDQDQNKASEESEISKDYAQDNNLFENINDEDNKDVNDDDKKYNKNGGKKKKNKVRYASGIADKTTNERDDVSVSEAVTSLELDSQAKEIIDNYETIKENNDSNESSGSISSGSFIKKQKKYKKNTI